MKRAMLTTMLAITTTFSAAGPFGCFGGNAAAPVKAQLEDGQVLYGELRTNTLVLDGALGRLQIPLGDVGEVVPVEGDRIGDADGYVKVWLRNGSELVGRWDDPELAMSISVGDGEIKVDLPPEQLQRLQTRGGELWPDTAVYRVRTTHGDDFLVDAETSRIAISSELGTFNPYLAECSSIRPVDGPQGQWRIELATGTVLIGQPVNDELELTMSLGPDQVTVPLASLQSMEQQTWAFAEAPHRQKAREVESERRPGRGLGGVKLFKQDEAPMMVEETSAGSWNGWEGAGAVAAETPAAAPMEPDAEMVDESTDGEDGWFRRDALQSSKSAAE